MDPDMGRYQRSEAGLVSAPSHHREEPRSCSTCVDAVPLFRLTLEDRIQMKDFFCERYEFCTSWNMICDDYVWGGYAARLKERICK